jgi:hypothetical protein
MLVFYQYVDSIPEETTIEYTYGGKTYNIKTLKNDTSTLKKLAKELLSTISKDDQYKLGSVVGGTLTPELVYTLGGASKTVQYTITFVSVE